MLDRAGVSARPGNPRARMDSKLNEFPQFATEIDGSNMHFVQVRSPKPNAMPVIARGVSLNHAGITPAMAERPTGTVTFLFTDIEGSTRLLRELGADAYARGAR